MKTARGSKNRNKNKAFYGIMIDGVFVHEGMEIEITGYDQDHMNNKEQITVRGIVKRIIDSTLCIWCIDGMRYIHIHGVKKIVYDFEEGE